MKSGNEESDDIWKFFWNVENSAQWSESSSLRYISEGPQNPLRCRILLKSESIWEKSERSIWEESEIRRFRPMYCFYYCNITQKSKSIPRGSFWNVNTYCLNRKRDPSDNYFILQFVLKFSPHAGIFVEILNPLSVLKARHVNRCKLPGDD